MNVEELYQIVQDYLYEERESLKACRQLAQESASPVVQYLSQLIADEKELGLKVFTEIANSLRGSIEFRPTLPQVPYLDETSASPEEFSALAQILAQSRANQLKLRTLARAVNPQRSASLWPELVRWTAANPPKEQQLLRFLLNRLHTRVPAQAAQHRKTPSPLAFDRN